MAKPAKDLAEIRAEAEAAQVEETARLDLRIARLQHRGQLATVLAGVQETEEAASWSRRDRRWNRRKARWSARVAPSVSAIVYAGAVGTAVDGQMSTAEHLFGWHWYAGAGMAGFVELVALAAAKTAHDTRLEAAEQGLYEPALFPRALAWAGAAFAAAVNAYAHEAIPLEAAVLGAASLVGIVVWEMRNSWPLRKALLAKNLVPAHLPRLGAKYSIRFPIKALDAKSASIENPAVSTRDEAIAAGAVRRSRRGPVCLGRLTVWGWWRSGPDRATSLGPDQTETAGHRPSGRDPADRTALGLDWVDRSGPDRAMVADRTGGPDREDQTMTTDRTDIRGPEDRTTPGGLDQVDDDEADRSGPDLAGIDQAVRDALPLVRPFAEALWADGQSINRRNLREAIKSAPADRRVKVETTVLGKVSQILRAEMPLSPEPVKAAG